MLDVQRRLLLGAALAGMLALGVACNSDEAGSVEDLSGGASGTATPSAGDLQSRQQFIDQTQARLDEVETKVSDLEAEAASMSDEAKADAQAKVEDLKTKVADLETKLARARTAGENDFEDIKADIEDSLESTQSDVDELTQELGA